MGFADQIPCCHSHVINPSGPVFMPCANRGRGPHVQCDRRKGLTGLLSEGDVMTTKVASSEIQVAACIESLGYLPPCEQWWCLLPYLTRKQPHPVPFASLWRQVTRLYSELGARDPLKCKRADSLLSLALNVHVLGKEAQLSYSHPGTQTDFKSRAEVCWVISNICDELQSNNKFSSTHYHAEVIFLLLWAIQWITL